jgi:hypothetical protein
MVAHRLTCVSAALVIALSGAFQPLPVSAESIGLYGLSLTSLDSVNPTTAATTLVADLSGLASNENIFPLVADPISQRLYARMSSCNPCGLAGINSYYIITITGSSAFVSPALSGDLGPLAAQPGGTLLWAVTNCYLCGTTQSVVTVNPMSGVETTVVTIPVPTYGPTDSLALAPESHTLYLAVSGALYLLDTQSGTFSSHVALSQSLGEIVYDTSSGQLFGSTGGNQLVRVDPLTGAETPVATLSAAYTLGDLAIASASHTVFADLTNNFTHVESVLSIADQTGTTSTSTSPASYLGALAYMDAPGRYVLPGGSGVPGARPVQPESSPGMPGTRKPVMLPFALWQESRPGKHVAQRLKPGYF